MWKGSQFKPKMVKIFKFIFRPQKNVDTSPFYITLKTWRKCHGYGTGTTCLRDLVMNEIPAYSGEQAAQFLDWLMQQGEETFHSIPEQFKRWCGGWEEIPERISGRRPRGERVVRTLHITWLFVLRATDLQCERWHRYVNKWVRQRYKLRGGGVMDLMSRDWHL